MGIGEQPSAKYPNVSFWRRDAELYLENNQGPEN